MLIAATAAQFIQSSTGRWHAGRVFVVWNRSPDLGGLLVWGRPTETDVDQIFSVVDGYHVHAPGCDVITDMSRIDSISSTAYLALLEGMRARQPFYSTRVRRHATIRGEGLIGGLAEGFYRMISAQHNWRIFTDAQPAFDWLELPDGAGLRSELEGIIAHASGVSPELRKLRDFLKPRLATVVLREVAQALGQSERTLNRRLRALGTSFRDELLDARIDAARRMLAETELKIELIALQVGCCSHTHLTNLFRRRTGQTPAEYRRALGESAGP